MAKMDQDKTKEIIRNLFDYQKNLTQQILQRIWFRNILYYMGEQWFEWAKSALPVRLNEINFGIC
jgi:hypothetical protein